MLGFKEKEKVKSVDEAFDEETVVEDNDEYIHVDAEQNNENSMVEKVKDKSLALISKYKLRIIAIGLACMLIIVLIVIISFAVTSNEGLRKSKSIAECIGETVKTAEYNTDLNLSSQSVYAGVNSFINSDYLYESSDETKVDGIHMPEWLITVDINDKEKIVNVDYYDFTVFKDSYKGQKVSQEIKLNSVNKGDSLSDISDKVDLDPYCIKYLSNGDKTYIYRYYYMDKADNEKAVSLSVTFDENEKYKSFDSSSIFPLGLK